MREILFRGKSANTGKWIIGDYEHFYLSDGELVVYISEWGERSDKVLPETVGQYTGLTDKNGKKIFEGDIVKVTDDNGETDLCSCGVGYVLFYDGCWYIDEEVNDGLYDVSKIYYIEVIGNIHDNPELLKGGANDV